MYPDGQPLLPIPGSPEFRPLEPPANPLLDALPTPEPLQGLPAPPPAAQYVPGTVLASRYRIVALQGKGGMGEIYRADDLVLDQPVALKFFPRPLTGDTASTLARFHHEVRTARQLSHPNICRVFDIGGADGRVFITMEFVDGEDLNRLLKRIGRLAPDKALEVACQLCSGLAFAHEAGILHLDLKPANVMLDGRGNVRITDFGLAQLTGQIGYPPNAGTPVYMAPEQLAGKEATVQSEIYSLGLVLHEVFSGRPGFNRSPVEAARESANGMVRSPGDAELAEHVPRIVAQCLQYDAARRPSSVTQIAAALTAGMDVRSTANLMADNTRMRLAWRLVFTILLGLALLLMLAPQATGLHLVFRTFGDESPAAVYTWFWCIALQLLLGMVAVTYLLRVLVRDWTPAKTAASSAQKK